MNDKLAFAKALQVVTAKIHATADIDDISLDVSQDICAVFEADRVTIYLANPDKSLLVSKVKIGLGSCEDIKLPMVPMYSVAGYVAINNKLVSLRDVYDDQELRSYDPPVYFLKEIDSFTGYKTKQLLTAPIVDKFDASNVIGVLQIINTKSGQPFPRMAEEGIVKLCETLAIAFRQRQKTDVFFRTKYDYLVLDGVVSDAELDLVLRSARRRAVDIERVLTDEFQVKHEAIGQSVSKFFRVPYEPFRADRPKPVALLKKLKPGFARSHGWVPLEEDDEGLVILTTDPEQAKRSGLVSQVFPKYKVKYRYCTNREFAATINHFYGTEDSGASVDTLIRGMETDTAEKPADGGDERTQPDSATVQLVNKIVVEAHKLRASDIHVEPRQGKGKTKVRFRVDGSLADYTEIPASYHAKVVARLKIMADLDISNRREPQDGKIAFKRFFPSLDIGLRVATVPTVGGKEDVVIRILTAGRPVPLEQLGLNQHNFRVLKSLMSKPYGLFLVCGPTGSGKTTTLHSVLGHINTPETKIWTAEDPVEITEESLRQVQINPRADLTFARVMRAFLRADPDVIMVGEMRDRETAAIGVEASLTGHRVLATIHTNSAPESIVRLLDMGMDPFHFADALLGIMAQRLAKRLCAKCKRPHVATRDEVTLLLTEYKQELKNTDRFKADPKAALEAVYAEWAKNYGYEKGQFILYEPVGCEACRGTGYSGRIALHELLAVTDTIKKNIQEYARVAEVLLTAMNEGMRTLKQDGMEKVLQGVTNMQAVRAVCIT